MKGAFTHVVIVSIIIEFMCVIHLDMIVICFTPPILYDIVLAEGTHLVQKFRRDISGQILSPGATQRGAQSPGREGKGETSMVSFGAFSYWCFGGGWDFAVSVFCYHISPYRYFDITRSATQM